MATTPISAADAALLDGKTNKWSFFKTLMGTVIRTLGLNLQTVEAGVTSLYVDHEALDASVTALALSKNNISATTFPTTSNDDSEGYGVGSVWIDTTSKQQFVCSNPSTGNAIWLGQRGLRLASHSDGTLVPYTSGTVVSKTIAVYGNTLRRIGDRLSIEGRGRNTVVFDDVTSITVNIIVDGDTVASFSSDDGALGKVIAFTSSIVWVSGAAATATLKAYNIMFGDAPTFVVDLTAAFNVQASVTVVDNSGSTGAFKIDFLAVDAIPYDTTP